MDSALICSNGTSILLDCRKVISCAYAALELCGSPGTVAHTFWRCAAWRGRRRILQPFSGGWAMGAFNRNSASRQSWGCDTQLIGADFNRAGSEDQALWRFQLPGGMQSCKLLNRSVSGKPPANRPCGCI